MCLIIDTIKLRGSVGIARDAAVCMYVCMREIGCCYRDEYLNLDTDLKILLLVIKCQCLTWQRDARCESVTYSVLLIILLLIFVIDSFTLEH